MDDWQPIAPHPGRLVAPVPLDPTGRSGPTRGQAFAGAGLESVTVVGGDLQDTDLVVARLHAAYERTRSRRLEWIVGDPGPTLDEVLDRRDGCR